MPVRTTDIVSNELKSLHDTSGLSWAKIARLEPYSGIPRGTLSAIAHGYVPPKWYTRFGIYPKTTVVVISGEVPPGAQAIGALRCGCGQHFIPNHPRRRKCFICSPFHRKVIK